MSGRDKGYRKPNDLMVWKYSYEEKLVGDNTFLNYLYNTRDEEALNFIMMAKHIATMREDRNSPWYYPSSKGEVENSFYPVIKTILAYKGTRFYNRYSLQLIRALFASARYEECIKTFDERFANVPDDDLMKRMSRDYVAGAALRLGNREAATAHFASTGDVESLLRFMCCDNPFETAALTNPESPKLLNFIEARFNGRWANEYFTKDSVCVREIIIPAARKIVAKKNVNNKAIWYYILAVGEGEFNNDYITAYRYIIEARKHRAGKYADNIRGYQIVVEAALGKQENLISNLKWLESKIADVTSPNKNYWEQVMQNIVFTRIAPWYAEHGDVITALQLANYGDNMPLKFSSTCWRYSTYYGSWSENDVLQARENPKNFNYHDFSNAFFLYITMQTPQTIERYIASLSSTAPLASYLNSRGYTSLDYLHDIAGTRYLAYRDYANAARVLSRISDDYQKLLNTDRKGFLKRDPFFYKSDLQKNDWYDRGNCHDPNSLIQKENTNHAKLYFARKMLLLEREIQSFRDSNKRGMARLKYAIGLENSFNFCWALTSYGRGYTLEAARNELHACGEWEAEDSQLPDEARIVKATKDAEEMQKKALAEITDPEVAARANLMLYNVRTIARRFPNTKVGRMMSAECDAWSDWVKSPLGKSV
ncbi:MAG: hypothetical protein NC194_02080 [Prevotella sp.]|nr:hypothetical protein [Bacteroides sp.]MCM1436664.1 hypothetical protein [Prevotella sp.]